MAVNLAPIGNDAPFVDASGNPLSSGNLYTYTAGSTTAQNTYTTSAGSVANANPIVLNSNGYPASGGSVVSIWLTAGVSYKFVLKDSSGNTIWTRDNISGINDTTVSIDQWVSGPTPTYVSATSFSLVGDQTSTFQAGRRVKTTNTSGTVYSTITASAFGAVTTVTVANDSGTLDSGLSAVSYGLLSATNPSNPLLADTFPVVSGSSDKTKKARFEVDGLTTATTRVITVPDRDTTIGPVLGTPQASTSGTSIDFTSIPAGTRRITINLVGVSIDNTTELLAQIGDSGGIENSGYLSTVTQIQNGVSPSTVTSTAGFVLTSGTAAATVLHGRVVLELESSSAFTWTSTSTLSQSNAAIMQIGAGSKSTSAELDRVRVTTVSGTANFDAGSINIIYE